MTEAQTRTLDLGDGKRTTIRLDTPTWQAVELLAAGQGLRWTRWVRQELAGSPDAENKHAVIRTAAMRGLLEGQFLAERAGAADASVTPLLTWASTLDDAQLAEELKGGLVDAGPIDLGGFKVRAGSDTHGRACIWIENMLRGCPHYAIPLPWSWAEVAMKVGSME
jgi:predicted DNA-binding ribbon-helix-helix protein